MSIKFVIAPDSFKESMDSFQAAEAMRRGIEKVFCDAEFEMIPMADGGEGTLKVIVNAQRGQFRKMEVTGPLGDKIECSYGYIAKEKKAVIEIAEACGLNLIPTTERNPLNTTTYGVGELIVDALNCGAEHIIVGLGGSSTNDGGLGMLQALGAEAYDKDNKVIGFGGRELNKLYNIDISKIDSRLKNTVIEVACDVENPLLGTNGATYTFGPQKGADEKSLKQLESGMKNYASVLKKASGIDIANTAKAGAAGGLGAAFMLLESKLVRGIDMVMENTDFEERIKDSDYVFTGEGSIDSQTRYGKTISGIARLCRKYDIPVIAVAGMVGSNIDELYDIGVTAVFGIVDAPKSLHESLRDGASCIEKTSENVARLISISKGVLKHE